MLIQTATLEQSFTLSLLPFLVSFFLGLIDPLIMFFWECRIRSYAQDREFPSGMTDNYIDFARKATASIRISTAMILTSVAGAISLIFNRGVAFWIFAILVFLSILLIILVDLGDPQDLAIGGIGPYNDDAIGVMILNLAFILVMYLVEIEFL